MKSIIAHLALIILIAFGAIMPATAETGQTPTNDPKTKATLFGNPLKGITRDKLREALKSSPLKPKRLKDEYWADIYDASNALEGATDLAIFYVQETGQFARLKYTIPSFMDANQVKEVVMLIGTKYGKPDELQGRYSLGPVKAIWRFKDGVILKVHRGWPRTTTYIEIIDPDNTERMEAEIEENERIRRQIKARQQSGAF